MEKFRIMATTTFGLEAVAKREITDLGFEDITVSDGYVEFSGTAEDVVKANLWLRTADKILIVLNRFKAMTFEDLFQGENLMPENAKFVVTGKSFKSQLSSVPACQSISEKAVIKAMQRKYKIAHFPKDGDEYTIQVALLKDIVTVTLNTSGPSLHKRGYRVQQVMAPLKETMAAALIMLSYWKPDRVLLDPCCGSGTIAIEAALIAKNIAPGLMRHFAAEKWDFIDKELWKKERREARLAIKQDFQPKIYGSDINANAVKMSMENADNAGVGDCIKFAQIPFNKLKLPCNYGVCISNPPYAERMGNLNDVERLYRDMGKLFNHNKTWSTYFITSHEGFEKLYGRRDDKKRKLININSMEKDHQRKSSNF